MAPGTRIEVRDLFFNTPARLKFLKTMATEQGAAADAIQRLALVNYRVAFRFGADGRTVAAMPRAASLLERLRQLFGAKLAERMLQFDYRNGSARAWGLAAGSQESFATARMVFTFVNGRAVRDRMLARAVAQAYATLIPRGRHPAVALMIELRAEEVDVNVHPMKTEVRFRNAGAVFELVYHALRARLSDQTAANGSGTTQTAANGSGTAQAAAHGGGNGQTAVNGGGSNYTDNACEIQNVEADGGRGLIEAGRAAQVAASSGAGLREATAADRPLRLVADAPAALAATSVRSVSATATPTKPLRGLMAPRAWTTVPPGRGRPPISSIVTALGVTDRAGRIAAREAQIPRYSELRVLGQLFTGYIVLEDISARSDDGLLLVDQHAAHERVTFERLKTEMRAGGIRTQALLTPATLELGMARASMVMAGIARIARDRLRTRTVRPLHAAAQGDARGLRRRRRRAQAAARHDRGDRRGRRWRPR